MKFKLLSKDDIASLFPEDWRKKLLTHLGIIVGFFIITLTFFKPLTENKVLYMFDILQHKGMAKELIDVREDKGEELAWTSRMFGGMPTYQLGIHHKANIFRSVNNALKFGMPFPMNMIFLLFLGFYFLCLTQGLNPWICGLGAAGYAFSSYFFIASEAGHTSKINALAYLAPIIAGVLLTLKKKYVVGLVVTALFVCLQLTVNHLQITYYTFFIIGAAALSYFIMDVIDKKAKQGLISIGILGLAVFLGIAPNISRLWTTQEYAKASIRGKTILKSTDDPDEGLDRDYAFEWSYGVGETFTLLAPNYYGGASSGIVTAGSEVQEVLKKNYGKRVADQAVKNWPTYYGSQRFTSGPVYVGAILVFLFILGLLLVEDRDRWWILGITLFAIMLSWGKNFSGLSDLMFDNFPYYNRFRAVSMLLVIAQFTIPFLGVLALKRFLSNSKELGKEFLTKRLYYAAGIAGGLILLLIVAGPLGSDFATPADGGRISSILGRFGIKADANVVGSLVEATYDDRASMFTMDLLRSLGLILAAATGLWLIVQEKVKTQYVLPAILLLVMVDLWTVNKRYLNEENFVKEKEFTKTLVPSAADTRILSDRDPNYRVLNLTKDTYQDASTSYFHKSIGGYHAAKLRRYNDMIKNYLGAASERIIQAFRAGGENPIPAVNQALAQSPALNMLNLKYLIYNPQAPPLENPSRLGHAWTVDEIKWVQTSDEEINSIKGLNPGKTAVVIDGFKPALGNWSPSPGAKADVKLTSYDPEKQVYSFNSSKDELVVFPEVFYEADGWHAYIDGNEVDHIRANYVLRALKVPSGQHTLEFRFEPHSYIVGSSLSLIGSLILLLVVLGGLYLTLVKAVEEAQAETA